MLVTAACHVHSTWSYDGKWPLSELAREFGARGYRVLLMTEHDRGFTAERLRQYRVACASVSTEKILLLPGIEYSDPTNVVHVLTWGDLPFLGEAVPTASLLTMIRKLGGLAVLAHPTRRNAWKCFAPDWSESLLGAEVWNRKTDGWAPSRTAPALIARGNLVPFVGMDFHDRRQIFPLAMELECDGAVNEHSALEALRTRRCRAMALGRPLERTSGGWLGGALRAGECCRRTAAVAFRLGRSVRNRTRALSGATRSFQN